MWKSMVTKIIDNIETIAIYSLQNKQTNKPIRADSLAGNVFIQIHKGDENTNFPWPAKVSTLKSFIFGEKMLLYKEDKELLP